MLPHVAGLAVCASRRERTLGCRTAIFLFPRPELRTMNAPRCTIFVPVPPLITNSFVRTPFVVMGFYIEAENLASHCRGDATRISFRPVSDSQCDASYLGVIQPNHPG